MLLYYNCICLTISVFVESSSAEVNRAKYRVKPVGKGKYKVISLSFRLDP